MTRGIVTMPTTPLTLRVSRMPAQMRHRKLVRDRVPDLIRSRGEIAETTVLSGGDYTTALLDKLVEEAVELRIAEPGRQIEELADVWEVLTTAVEQLGFTMAEVEQAAAFKRIVRGGFSERLWLEAVRP